MFGVGLRYEHYKYVIQNKPNIDFFEVHTENFFCEGGFSLNFLQKLSNFYPISFHCVGTSLGSAHGVEVSHLQKIKFLIDEIKPIMVSDHLSWSNSSKKGVINDLLPVIYNKEWLEIFCKNIDFVQNYFQSKILIENPSAYIEFTDSNIEEWDFINIISQKTGCDILLDLNNIFVNSNNFGFNAKEYIDKIDLKKIKEIHLAGHSDFLINGKLLKVDTHDNIICDGVIDLYKYLLGKIDIVIPTIFEWDQDIPEFKTIEDEIKKVEKIANKK